MKSLFLLACVSIALAASVACAASRDDKAPEADAAPPSPPDAETPDADREATDPKEPATCSDVGWCVTPLPDADLTMIDIWPFEGRAFAVAQSGTLGVKVLEWVEDDRQWSYIDDNTQNDDGFGKYVGRIWAPNEDEVYYAVSPGYVYHGRRTQVWTWERRRLPMSESNLPGYDLAAPGTPESAKLGVWGTSADDVYAWRANTIFHLQSVDGGAADWVPEYIGPEDSFRERVFVLSAGGSDKNDVWFAGGRGNSVLASCPVVIRKTRDGYRHVFDGVFGYGPSGATCTSPPGTLSFDEKTGSMTDIQSVGIGHMVAFRYSGTVTRILPADDGGYGSVSMTLPSSELLGPRSTRFYSLWSNGEDAWLCGPGLIMRGPVTGDAGAYGVSTVALTGAPLDKDLYRVRGTSNDNLWAIGARYAFHKTTP